MTIDEAIAHAREVAEENRDRMTDKLGKDQVFEFAKCIECAEEHEQLAEWLEELKAIKSDDNLIFGDGLEQGYAEGYEKAIDDFAEKLHDLCGFEIDDIQYPYLLHESRIDEVAEQLKAGDIDGNERTDT